MTSSREQILQRLRRAARDNPEPAADTVPAPPGTWDEQATRFTVRAKAAAATVARVSKPDDLCAAVVEYLTGIGLPPLVHVSAGLTGFSTAAHGRLRCDDAPMPPDGATLVSGCYAAVADEGVIVMAADAGCAAETAFLAATHIVVVRPSQMLDSLEALWARMRASDRMPRMFNLILGPSRTADLGLPSRFGAHGPLRVHAILVDSDAHEWPANPNGVGHMTKMQSG
jgi:L-lactate dehydrogenase complex protein LldG